MTVGSVERLRVADGSLLYLAGDVSAHGDGASVYLSRPGSRQRVLVDQWGAVSAEDAASLVASGFAFAEDAFPFCLPWWDDLIVLVEQRVTRDLDDATGRFGANSTGMVVGGPSVGRTHALLESSGAVVVESASRWHEQLGSGDLVGAHGAMMSSSLREIAAHRPLSFAWAHISYSKLVRLRDIWQLKRLLARLARCIAPGGTVVLPPARLLDGLAVEAHASKPQRSSVHITSEQRLVGSLQMVRHVRVHPGQPSVRPSFPLTHVDLGRVTLEHLLERGDPAGLESLYELEWQRCTQAILLRRKNVRADDAHRG